MAFKPADNIQDLQYFGEFGGVNPSISDATTFTFVSAKTMSDTFEGNTEGCHLYARHTTPSNLILRRSLSPLWKAPKPPMSLDLEWVPLQQCLCNSVVQAIMWCRVVRFMEGRMRF